MPFHVLLKLFFAVRSTEGKPFESCPNWEVNQWRFFHFRGASYYCQSCGFKLGSVSNHIFNLIRKIKRVLKQSKLDDMILGKNRAQQNTDIILVFTAPMSIVFPVSQVKMKRLFSTPLLDTGPKKSKIETSSPKAAFWNQFGILVHGAVLSNDRECWACVEFKALLRHSLPSLDLYPFFNPFKQFLYTIEDWVSCTVIAFEKG